MASRTLLLAVELPQTVLHNTDRNQVMINPQCRLWANSLLCVQRRQYTVRRNVFNATLVTGELTLT